MHEFHPPTGVSKWVGLGVLVLITFGIAGIGGLVSVESSRTYYAELIKPAWSPPPWIFGPVWTTLYGMMAVAAWLVWKQGGFASAKTPLIAYGVQLALNAAWTPLFFGLQQPGWAFAEILVLWGAIVTTLILFWRDVAPAGILFLPYLGWVTFAAYLNYTLWRLNA